MPFRPALAVAFATLVAVAPVLAAPVLAAAAPSAAVAAPAEDVALAPKVVIVVGATESTTASYRTDADAIAAEAIKWTPNVVKVYSPNATWAVVKAAAQGASIFVYLGHGNGFPSPYGTTLVPDKVDGMGLNTTLGLGDTDKKYYGESCIDGLAAANDGQCPNNGSGIRLADNAIVFLNHLCYAPGAGEPGAPEPTVATAEQRVDDYASGFIRAGARAVVADDYMSTVPDMIRAIFTTHGSILDSWRTTWGYHGNEIPYVPARNPAFQAILDPETWTTGFKRSIVTDADLTTDQIVAGAAKASTSLAPSTLAVPGAASVVTAGLPVDTAADLATAQGATLAAGTKLRVDGVVAGNPPPDAVQVHTLDNAVSGWVSSAGVAPADSASPELWALTGSTTVSPNFDGTSDHLDLWGRLSEAVPWTFTVTDGGGTVLRTQAGSTDLFALSWDALPGGSPAPADTYHWTLHASDAWGNAPLDASGDITVTDEAIPTTAVTSFKGLNGPYTNAATLTYQVTFASDVTGFTPADLIRGGTATGCVVNAPTGGPTTWTFTISSCTAGSVTLTLKAGSVADAALAIGPPVNSAGPTVRIDRTKPTVTAPKTSFRGAPISGSTLPVTVAWTGSDDSGGVGIVTYDVARSLDGAAFSIVATGLTTASFATTVVSGHAYRYEARARDRAGNVGSWIGGSTLHPALQQTSAGFTWTGTWATQAVAAYSAGSARVASTAGASASYTFSGQAFAIVASRDPSYGQFKVYVDGVFVLTVDTFAASHGDQVIVYGKMLTFATHTVKLVVVGTAGRPTVVFDALEVLR